MMDSSTRIVGFVPITRHAQDPYPDQLCQLDETAPCAPLLDPERDLTPDQYRLWERLSGANLVTHEPEHAA